jgi:hypothetical protein
VFSTEDKFFLMRGDALMLDVFTAGAVGVVGVGFVDGGVEVWLTSVCVLKGRLVDAPDEAAVG